MKLASNENPLGPSPAALEALGRASGELHRYPDGAGSVLTERLANKLGVAAEQIVLGNGSNEIIELLVRVFTEPGDEVLFSEDAFLIYGLVTRGAGASAVAVPPREHGHDLERLAARVGPRTRLVFLANPNNPTGTIFRRAEWERFLERVPGSVVVAVDEAYSEYVTDPDYPEALDDLERHPGLVVLKTFSKVYGLAGLRIGYGVGPRELIGGLARLRQPFNTNSLAQVAAAAALDDEQHLRASRELVERGRERYRRAFDELGLEEVPSQANFVLVEVGDGGAVSDAMLRRGVIVRSMEAYAMPSKVRISYGTEQENERCITALAASLGELSA